MNKTQENNKINRPHEQHIKGKQNITRNYFFKKIQCICDKKTEKL